MQGIRRIGAFIALSLLTTTALAEDIDLFASGLVSGAAAESLPNVLFVLDNSAAWNNDFSNSEGKQGQAQIRAIRATLEKLLDDGLDLNVGLFAYETGASTGGYSDEGGYVRFDLQKLSTNASQLWPILDAIEASFEPEAGSDSEGASQSAKYGNLAADVYAYLAGDGQMNSGARTVAQLADAGGYTQPYEAFRSPLRESDVCSNTYVILVSNVQPNPKTDTTSNSQQLRALYSELGETPTYAMAGESGSGMPMPAFETVKQGNNLVSHQKNDGLPPVPGVDFNLDDWTKFLFEIGVPLSNDPAGSEADVTPRIPVVTFTIDTFADCGSCPKKEHSALMESAARQGGGYRQQATTTAEIEYALSRIFGDILDVNSSFAAVTLPLSAGNREQVENKVFVGMFRPASQRKPRWMGNLKQYQIAKFGATYALADVNYDLAVNTQTDFIKSCATSFWTEDSSEVDKADGSTGPYFADLGLDPSPVSECLAEFRGDRSVLSDSPDGGAVEKGGAAQQIRGQATPQRASTRLLMKDSGGSLTTLTGGMGSDEIYRYFIGEEAGLRGGDLLVKDETGAYVSNPALNEEEVEPVEGLRPSIHGDVVHSRPLTITYGPAASGPGSEFRLFYGANDGLFRALNPATGLEDWALIADSHLAYVERLYRNTPTVDYFGLDPSLSSEIGAQKKQYFFDGSTGAYTVYDQDDKLVTGWLYPTMRRGGRQIYALDVSPVSSPGVPPTTPTLKWIIGCPDNNSNAGCTPGFDQLGQTWSVPVAAKIKGYVGGGTIAEPDPVLIFGGGWDDCLDVDQKVLPLGSCSLGNRVYVVNADTGTLLREFSTDSPVVAEVSAVDVDEDGYADFAYAASAAGSLYRIDFAQFQSESSMYSTSLAQGDWSINKVAQAAFRQIRFMNKPALAPVKNRVFVALGTGDRERPLKQNYPYESTVANRFYAFIDEVYGDARPTVNLDQGPTAMEKGMLNAANGLSGPEDKIINYHGWYLDLDARGEQVVNPAAISVGQVLFNSYKPEGGSQGLCRDIGTSTAYALDLFTGKLRKKSEFGSGMPIPPIIFTVKLDSSSPSCEGDGCGPGEVADEVLTLCIGCEGFEPLELWPNPDDSVREDFQAEDIDRL